MTDEGRVLYARQGGQWVLRFEGSIRYTMAHAVDRFLDELFAREHPEVVSVDLTAATAIDSTGIGLLAKIADGLRRAGRRVPVVFSTNPEITETLTGLCLDEVCAIVEQRPQPGEATEIPATHPDERELAQTITAAHRLLCDIGSRNRAAFESVLQAFSGVADGSGATPAGGAQDEGRRA